jgi:hypothetical protein
MSLISSANFAAPLRSKVQVVGIFALAVLVAVLRMAGSGHSLRDGAYAGVEPVRGQATKGRELSAAEEMDSYFAARQRSKPRNSAPSAAGDITVDKLLQGDDSEMPTGRRAAVNTVDEGAQPEKLNDIKRSLGLE